MSRRKAGRIIVCLILAVAVAFSAIPVSGAGRVPTVKIENEIVNFPDTQPEIISGTTMLPIRCIAEKLSMEVNWNGRTRTVTLSRGSTNIQMTIGSKEVKKNGRTMTLAVSPYIKENRTMVPLRFISEALGYNVGWSKQYYSVVISKKAIEAWMYEVERVNTYTEEDLYWLSRAIYAEMGCDWMPDWVQQATGSVILNRVNSKYYANTVKEVLWQPGQYGCVWNGSIYQTPTQKCVDNARYILEKGSTLPETVLSQDSRVWGPVYTSYYDSVLGITVYFCHIY